MPICGTIILSRPDPAARAGHAGPPSALPRDEDGPVFAEPWQAQAFALAVKLSQQGYFTWKEWSAALAEELRAAADRDEPDDGSRYFEYWLAALERLVAAKGLSNPEAMYARKEAWAEAYRRTPHGKPVYLSAAAPAEDGGPRRPA
jgi:nitrile hydratase accessory protein